LNAGQGGVGTEAGGTWAPVSRHDHEGYMYRYQYCATTLAGPLGIAGLNTALVDHPAQ